MIWITVCVALCVIGLFLLAGASIADDVFGLALSSSLLGLALMGLLVTKLTNYQIAEEVQKRIGQQTEQVESNKQGVTENE